MSNDNPNPPPNQNQNRNRQDQDPSSSTPDSLKPKNTNSTNNSSKQAEKSKPNQDPSLLNRIQTSATGLFRDTITNPNAHAIGSDLGHATNGGKASSSSSSSSSRWMTGSQDYYDPVAGASSTSSSSRNNAAAAGDTNVALTESFRSTPWTQENNNAIFGLESFNQEHFQHDYGNEYHQYIGNGKGKGKGKNRRVSISSSEEYDAAWIHAVAIAQRSNNNNNNYHRQDDNHDDNHDTNDTQTYTDHKDGEAVVSLLSDPSFQPGLADADDENNMHEDPDTAVPAPLTADEIKILDSFRRQQSSSSSSTTTHPETKAITPHSLIPDIDTFLAENDTTTTTSSSSSSNAALRDAVLHNLPGAEDWMAVNDRYQDEVWGFLRPALEAASKEIDENNQKENEPAREGPAVRRLKMILRHMQ